MVVTYEQHHIVLEQCNLPQYLKNPDFYEEQYFLQQYVHLYSRCFNL